MKTFKSFNDIIEMWPSTAHFGHAIGILQPHANSIKIRNSIPSKYWLDTVNAAKRDGIKGVTLEVLATLARKPQ